MNPPVIFCHYGNSEYLRYTLQCARLNNPGKEIVLLGDPTNRTIAKHCGVRHVSFEDFNDIDEIKVFDSVYRLVQGKLHNTMRDGRDWVNFVFRRWFFIYGFIVRNNAKGFWHFDSDNMIVEDLSTHESKFSAYDCTEQCDGSCMNGYISGPAVVKNYIDKINSLFQRADFLREQQREFDVSHPEFAFTEMRAYEIYREENQIRSIKLATVIDGSTFDDCICLENGMTMEGTRFGKRIKKIYLAPGGFFLCERKDTCDTVQMNSLNLSWVPLYLFQLVLDHSYRRGCVSSQTGPFTGRTLAVAPVPFEFKVRYWIDLVDSYLRGLLQYKTRHLEQ